MEENELYALAYVAETLLYSYPQTVDDRDCVKQLDKVFKFWRFVDQYQINPKPVYDSTFHISVSLILLFSALIWF